MVTEISKQIGKYFIDQQQTISAAESVTSGRIQLTLSDVEEAEKFFQGGITTYNVGQKYKHLSVEPIHALQCNSVSENVAEQMARNVCQLFNSDWGIGVTGYATPVPESDNKIFCYYAICFRGNIVCVEKLDSQSMPPEKVKQQYADVIIKSLVSFLKCNRNLNSYYH